MLTNITSFHKYQRENNSNKRKLYRKQLKEKFLEIILIINSCFRDKLIVHAVPLNVSGLCNLGPDTLRKLRDKIAWVSAILHGRLKILLFEIVSD